MRKFLALALVALLALTMAFAVVGCAQQEQTATPESSPMSEPMMQDTSSMMADTMVSDTSSMQH